MLFNSNYCCVNCNSFFEIISIIEFESRLRKKIFKKQFSNIKSIKNHDINHFSTYSFLKMARKKNHEVVVMWFEHFETFNKFVEQNKYLLINIFINKIAIIIVENYEKFFNKLRKKLMSRKKLRIHFFEKLKNKTKCFDVKKANKLLFRRDYDHKINLILEIKFRAQKIYELIKNQALIIKTYVNEMLKKNFIRSSFFRFAILVLIIKKFEKNFRVCINYKSLNALIIKNRNCFFLIKKTLTRLCAVKYYIKFDVIAIFNEIRIRKNDKKKTTFLIKYDLYKYVVMFFDFCNVFETFQLYINDVFKKYLNDFCIVYLNDVLIYNNNKKNHIKHVRKILNKLHVVKLFLNINKCEFFVNEVKYLDFIIIIESVKINSKKVQAIFNWKTFLNIKNVQTFLNFVNFYKKFIAEYSKLIQLFIVLIKTSEKKFVFSWNSNDLEKKAFLTLKIAFIIASILQHFDLDKKIWIKFDAFDWMIIAVLFQKNSNDVLRSITFMLQKMLSTECNYEIYDKKLLVIIRAFEK